ncbi:baseplate J/gp47 family protein [Thermogemmatispora onikobensis]|uniref:baseplate J/gp47 family protein n=1 Tax=Thermogemmatispora onikobensis TaxID=732234 RepID=UPI000853D83A|nr:baseplate J/gp47 family protein [Thermogemmatispora onikobensis]
MKEHHSGELPPSEVLRSQALSIIEVRPGDPRQQVLTAILTQEKLGRRQTLLLLPADNKAFYRKVDFEGLRELQRKLQMQLVIIAQPGSKVANYARQQGFPVFSSLEDYATTTRLYQPSPGESAAAAEELAPPPAPARGTAEEPRAGALPGPASAAPESEAPPTASSLPTAHERTAGTLLPLVPVMSGRPPSLLRHQARPSSSFLTRKRLWLLLGLVIGLLLLISIALIPLSQFFGGAASAASVTIVPQTRPLQQIYTLTGQPGVSANAARHQIGARLLASSELRQSRQVPASGHGVTPATRAKGVLTFYNALPVPQRIPKGTILSDQRGVQVITDQTASLPAATPPVESSANVLAHALQPGSQGNLPAFAFHTVSCCSSGITVQNSLAFSGGADPQPYTYVQQSDIDQASTALQMSLIAAAQRDLQARAAANERFVGGAECPALTSADHQAGDRVSEVTVTVTVVCSGEVYDQVGARVLAASLLANDAARNPGPGYNLAGQIATNIVSATLDPHQQGLITLRVQAAGIWAYRLDPQERQRLANLIKGKSKDQALALLRQQPGIQSVSLALSGNGSRLPDNPGSISIHVATVAGLKASPLPTISPSPATRLAQPASRSTPSVIPSPLPRTSATAITPTVP